MRSKAKAHPVAQHLIAIPGVGPVNALSFIALVDDPTRFSRASDVGAFLGLTQMRHQSGQVDWSGRVSKCGGGAMRGFRKAAVATARKIAVLMLTLWKNETGYQWTKEATI